MKIKDQNYHLGNEIKILNIICLFMMNKPLFILGTDFYLVASYNFIAIISSLIILGKINLLHLDFRLFYLLALALSLSMIFILVWVK